MVTWDGPSDLVIVAVVALFGTMFSPLILAWLTGRQRHADKLEDYARQDAVAAAANKAAKEAADAAALLIKTNQENSDKQLDKLGVIHTLVNSGMTAAIQAELDATIRELALMHEIIDLKVTSGGKPLPVAERAVVLTEARVAELTAVLKDRKLATEAAAKGIEPLQRLDPKLGQPEKI